jgi:hypothetical protein
VTIDTLEAALRSVGRYSHGRNGRERPEADIQFAKTDCFQLTGFAIDPVSQV